MGLHAALRRDAAVPQEGHGHSPARVCGQPGGEGCGPCPEQRGPTNAQPACSAWPAHPRRALSTGFALSAGLGDRFFYLGPRSPCHTVPVTAPARMRASGRGTPAGGPAVSAAPLDHPLPPSHSSYACPNTYSNILPAKLTSALLLLGMPHARRPHHLHLKPHLPGAGRPRHPDPHHPHLRLTHTRWHSRWHSTHTHKGALNVARRHHLRMSSNRKKCSESYTAAMSALSHTSASNCCAQASATSASNSSLP